MFLLSQTRHFSLIPPLTSLVTAILQTFWQSRLRLPVEKLTETTACTEEVVYLFEALIAAAIFTSSLCLHTCVAYACCCAPTLTGSIGNRSKPLLRLTKRLLQHRRAYPSRVTITGHVSSQSSASLTRRRQPRHIIDDSAHHYHATARAHHRPAVHQPPSRVLT
ncbi:hypothetical protein DEU56DRAFT_124881 [Suillus clintonianus]|uniref:uncharacterized protein n=1 Tax=Suillus clintonianus TaxID=1904413 RepID=UPI001B8719E6|nr:uncharacterized protein DEU56DRAFT_124881 [Suillus clintonianus]KAG2119337.1 hypothetical protein DEU56DRAFT_124881 [Suillus clintonianus]